MFRFDTGFRLIKEALILNFESGSILRLLQVLKRISSYLKNKDKNSMKKFLSAIAITVMVFTVAFAQKAKDSTVNKQSKTVKRKPIATTNGGKLDMRYKRNKNLN